MQRQLEKQQQQMEQLWQENQEMKKVKDELVPNLMDSGLLGHNPDTGNLQVAENWQQHQALLAYNSKLKQQSAVQAHLE